MKEINFKYLPLCYSFFPLLACSLFLKGSWFAATAKWVFSTQVHFFPPQISINWFFLRDRRSSIQAVECEIKFWKDEMLVSTLILGRCGICIWGWWMPVQGLLMAVEKLLTCWALDYPWVAYHAHTSLGEWWILPLLLLHSPNMLHLADPCALKDILVVSAVISTCAGRRSCCFVAAPVWLESRWLQLPGWSHFLFKPASLAKGCSDVKLFYHGISDGGAGICIKMCGLCRSWWCSGKHCVVAIASCEQWWAWQAPLCPSTSCSWHLWREQMRVSCKYMCWKHLPGTLN